MAITKQRYPLSTANGQSIPFDIIRPVGVLRKSFNSSTGTAAEALASTVEIMMVRATEDCFITFENLAALKPTSASPSAVVANTLYLQKDEVQAISPPALFYSVIGDTLAGVLTVQLLETWSGLVTEAQLKRK